MTVEEKFWIEIGDRLEGKFGSHPKVWKPKYTKDFLDNHLSYKVGQSYLRNTKVRDILAVSYEAIGTFIPSYATLRRIFKTKESKGALSTKNIFSIYFEEMSYLDYTIKYQIQDDSMDKEDDNNNEPNEIISRNEIEKIEKNQSEIVDFKEKLLSDSLNKDEEKLLNKAIAHFNLEEYKEAFSILESLANKFSSPRVLLNYGYLLYKSDRVNNLEMTKDKKEDILGFLITEFEFENLKTHNEDDYAVLMFVDYDKIRRRTPRKILVRELLSLPEGDLVDLYQDMLLPKSDFTIINNNANSPRVFLSYAREDYSIVDNIFKELRKNGIDAWQDDKSLRIGDEFEDKINEAIEKSDFAIVFLSTKSVSKIGFVSKEFRKILDSAKYRPFGFPFALPVKLDDCKVPKEFSKCHWLEIYNDDKKVIHGLIQQIKEQYEIINS